MTKPIRLELNSTLTVEDVIDIINIKRFDCINYNDCLEELVIEDLKKKDENEENEENDVWICSSLCGDYERDFTCNPQRLLQFDKDEIKKVSSEINNMTSKNKFKFFLSSMTCKQIFEKRSGGFNVEESTRTTILDGRTKRKGFKRSKK